jgi:hypothetical protein
MKRSIFIAVVMLLFTSFVYADQLTIDCGNQVRISATPQTGYHFTQWSDGSIEPERIISPVSDTILTAYFAINTYTITVSGDNGTITGGGSYEHGAIATLQVTPDECYQFIGWSDGNTDNPRQVEVIADANYVAQFEIIRYNVTVKSEQESQGTVTIVPNP